MGRKAGKKLKKLRQKRKKSAAPAPVEQPDSSGSSAVKAAAEYLEAWALHKQQKPDEPPVWKFNKTRQTFLLRSWPRSKLVSGATFKLLLAYLSSCPDACRERTVVQAREVASTAEKAEAALVAAAAEKELSANGDEDEVDAEEDRAASAAAELEERRAHLQIQLSRSLRVLKVLGE